MVAKLNRLLVIVGETASGKSALAIDLAKQFNGQIICADSRTIYKGMDIGTAKPSKEDQQQVTHHLIDLIEPNQIYSAAQFKHDAEQLTKEITKKGKLPIMVGGTGLYIDSIIFNYEFRPVNEVRQAELNQLNLEQLQTKASELGISEEDIDFNNRRHLQRAVETGKVLKNSQQLRPNTLVIGLKLDKDVLEQRINRRVDKMIEAGLVDEVKKLGQTYDWDTEAMSGIGYKVFGQYIRGEIDLEQAKAGFIKGDLSLAKRQRTWFKRNKYIHWISNSKDAKSLVQTFLAHTEL